MVDKDKLLDEALEKIYIKDNLIKMLKQDKIILESEVKEANSTSNYHVKRCYELVGEMDKRDTGIIILTFIVTTIVYGVIASLYYFL